MINNVATSLLAVLTVLGLWAAGRGGRGWLVNAVVEIPWIWWDIYARAWGLIPLGLVIAAVSIHNFRRDRTISSAESGKCEEIR